MRAERGGDGFTLIEMLAVVAIFALLASFVAPNLGVLSSRRLEQQAEQLSSQLELARQRAIVTGAPHRLAIDLDAHAWWLEWFVSEAEALGEPEPEPEPLDLRAAATIPLSPPPETAREFRPLPGMFGRVTRLEDSLRFARVATPEGEAESGAAYVVFERDGTASASEIVLADEDGHALLLEVQTLAEAVRIHDVER
jgi:prepilin-type N-terminal cleavage/methylation domain-containing protein